MCRSASSLSPMALRYATCRLQSRWHTMHSSAVVFQVCESRLLRHSHSCQETTRQPRQARTGRSLLVPLGRLERPHMAPEATALSTELQGHVKPSILRTRFRANETDGDHDARLVDKLIERIFDDALCAGLLQLWYEVTHGLLVHDHFHRHPVRVREVRYRWCVQR